VTQPSDELVLPAASPLSRRVVLGGGLGLAVSALVGAPRAAEAAVPVVGRIKQTYLAAGGKAVLGAPLKREVKRRISSRNTYAQQFQRGTVWWGSGVGAVDRPAERVRLSTARNFRPVLGVRDLWRTDDLDGCSALEKRIVSDLGIESMVAMNSGSDPSIPGVKRYQYRISNAGTYDEFYRGYVTRAASRESVGRVLRLVARSKAPVLIHCAGGKDRTGWLSELAQRVAGVAQEQRDADYLATKAYSGGHVDLAWLGAARDQLTRDYGTLERYLTEGCDLSTDDLARLRTRLV